MIDTIKILTEQFLNNHQPRTLDEETIRLFNEETYKAFNFLEETEYLLLEAESIEYLTNNFDNIKIDKSKHYDCTSSYPINLLKERK